MATTELVPDSLAASPVVSSYGAPIENEPGTPATAPALAKLRDALAAAVPALRRRQTVVSLDEQPYGSGSSIETGARAHVVRRRVYLGFIDLAPGNTWPHDCLYVLCDATSGAPRVLRGRQPPRLTDGRRLVVIARGEDVPPWGTMPPYTDAYRP